MSAGADAPLPPLAAPLPPLAAPLPPLDAPLPPLAAGLPPLVLASGDKVLQQQIDNEHDLLDLDELAKSGNLTIWRPGANTLGDLEAFLKGDQTLDSLILK